MEFFKKILKTALSQRAIKIVLPLDEHPYFESETGLESLLEGEPISESAMKILFQNLFIGNRENRNSDGPIKAKLNVVNFGILKMIGLKGDKPQVLIFIPPAGDKLYEEAWIELSTKEVLKPIAVAKVEKPTNFPKLDPHTNFQSPTGFMKPQGSNIPEQINQERMQFSSQQHEPSKLNADALSTPLSDAIETAPPGQSEMEQLADKIELTPKELGVSEESPYQELVSNESFTPFLTTQNQPSSEESLGFVLPDMQHQQANIPLTVPPETKPSSELAIPALQVPPQAMGDDAIDSNFSLGFPNMAMDSSHNEDPADATMLDSIGSTDETISKTQEIESPQEFANPIQNPGQIAFHNSEHSQPAFEQPMQTTNPQHQQIPATGSPRSHVESGSMKINFARDLDSDPTKGKKNEIDIILQTMVDLGASDAHLSVGEPLAFRIDGDIVRQDQNFTTVETMESLLEPIIPAKNSREFIRDNDTDFAYEADGIGRFRVNLFRNLRGVGSVFRFIPSQIPTADDLSLPESIRKLCTLGKGLVVVTGPTGSGKSTTLAAMIDLINKTRQDHILTIEDPVEFVHQQQSCLINQRELFRHTNSFARALRAALREDPDIVLIGEMRDLETVAIAIETAETGHLVFGTLHTNTAISTVDRLIDQFPGEQQQQIRAMLSESLKGVVAQTLLKKKGGGRLAAHEVLIANPAISSMIREGKTHMIANQMQTQKAAGNLMLNEALLNLVTAQLVEPAQAYLKAIDKDGFVAALQKKGIKIDFIDKLTA